MKDLVDGFFIFTTLLNVEYLNGTFKFAILYSDFSGALRGFILFLQKKFLKKGKMITIGSYHITIEEATNKKIKLVKMILQE